MNHSSRVATATAAISIGMCALASCSTSGSASDASSATASSAPTSAAASPSGPSSSANGSSAAESATITIEKFKYSGPSSVAPNTTITVKNEDTEAHTVTADTGKAFDVKIDPGKSATFTAPKAAGSYAYHCTYHSNMHATLKVS
jgi:plastocyanin